MKKTALLCLLSLLLTLACLNAQAETTMTNIANWADEVTQLQQKTGFLDRWTDDDRAQMQELLDKYQLTLNPASAQSTPHDILYAVFESCYGRDRHWTPTQMNAWDTVRYQWGLADQIYYIVPEAGEGTVEQAIQAGWQAVLNPENIEGNHYSHENLVFSDYEGSAYFMQYDEGKVWRVCFQADGRPSSTFDVFLWQNGVATVSYTDYDSIANVHAQWTAENGWRKFPYWTLEKKVEFYQLMLTMWETEMDKYGRLPEIAAFVLSHHHALPAEDEMDEETALSLAISNVPDDVDLSGLKTSVLFYRDDDVHGVYEINFVASSPVYTVWVDADTGSVTNSKNE